MGISKEAGRAAESEGNKAEEKIEYMLKMLTLGVVYEALSENYRKTTKKEG